ncbi:hypothetical protein BAUCODRAFT_532450 [Baudoinia panamericana UAMH 10762]|uniref:Uncharacterized protein n=1 Tax=Baudoinia panamericana (strain UAMH 10762) TaxID=717646 RepID=M2N805_BAUPA|nr:uncharacterized protein BAUCODRAFT_532450 [Baudoinia panamericana UAMH 10762]EMC95224.1 hypothetical protein BAUCODRAFT_532450 [Baudoinia panamericana UAMH 10762]
MRPSHRSSAGTIRHMLVPGVPAPLGMSQMSTWRCLANSFLSSRSPFRKLQRQTKQGSLSHPFPCMPSTSCCDSRTGMVLQAFPIRELSFFVANDVRNPSHGSLRNMHKGSTRTVLAMECRQTGTRGVLDNRNAVLRAHGRQMPVHPLMQAVALMSM